jgi:hypothetical protein
MPRRVTAKTAWEIGLALPHVEESTTYGTPALKVRGQLIACIPTHRSAEPNSLVVSVDFRDRRELLAEEPDTYYLPDHYADGPYVLVRLSRVRVDALRDLIGGAYRVAAAKAARPRTRPRRRPASR